MDRKKYFWDVFLGGRKTTEGLSTDIKTPSKMDESLRKIPLQVNIPYIKIIQF